MNSPHKGWVRQNKSQIGWHYPCYDWCCSRPALHPVSLPSEPTHSDLDRENLKLVLGSSQAKVLLVTWERTKRDEHAVKGSWGRSMLFSYFFDFCFVISRHGFSVYPWFSWNLLCTRVVSDSDPPASASRVMGLQACATTAWLEPSF